MENIQAQSNESSQSSEVDLMAAFESQTEGSETRSEGIQSEQQNQQSFEIDEKFKDLPEYEARLRTYQSKYDKLYADHEKALREMEEKNKISSFFDELLQDDEVLEAFLSERKPELIQSKSGIEKVELTIKQKMQEEFGDYKPTRDEAEDDPGGKAWLYFKRLDELYSKLGNQTPNKIKSVKELRAERLEKQKLQEQQIMQQMDEVKRTMNWQDQDLERFKEWANKLNIPMLAKMYNFAVRTMRVPGVTQIQGSPTQASAREQFLKNL